MAAPPEVASFFLLLGAAVLVGYVGNLLFRKYRFSDIILLLGVGLVAGPALDLVDAGQMEGLFAILAPFGLMLVLFDGGMGLAWHDLRRVGPRAIAVTLGTWVVTAATLGVLAHYALGFQPRLALLLGTALAGPGVTTLLPLLPQIGLPNDARAFITIEMTLGSMLNAVTTTAIASVMLADTTAVGGLGVVGAQFAVGAAVGVLGGLVWSRILHYVKAEGYVFAATMGVLLALYVYAEQVGGGGFLMALAFGLVVGNAGALEREGGLPALRSLDPETRRHGSELIFIFRSLYFVYLGMAVAKHASSPKYALGALLLVAAALLIRFLTMGAMRAAGPAQAPATTVLFVSLVPRGLSTAIVVSVPIAMGVPGAEEFLPYVFFVIVAANVVAMGGLWAYERARHRADAPEPVPDAVSH